MDTRTLVEQYLYELDTSLDGLKVDSDGTKRFYRFGKLNDPSGGAAVIYPDGSLEHWVNGQRHAEDEPAIKQVDGDEWWYLNNKLHSTSGPAVVKDGKEEYWVNGVKIDYDTFMRKY